MVLKLYGHPLSPPTNRVALILHEKKVPFELVFVDILKGEQKSAPILEKQPFGLLPFIVEDDGFVLYESRAIAWHIATKYADQGTPLIPSDPKTLSLMMQAWDVEISHFDGAARGALLEGKFKQLAGKEKDEEVFNKHLETLNNTLDILDKSLSKQKYLVGDELPLVDLFYFPGLIWLTTLMGGSELVASRPALKRWYDIIVARPTIAALEGGVKSTA